MIGTRGTRGTKNRARRYRRHCDGEDVKDGETGFTRGGIRRPARHHGRRAREGVEMRDRTLVRDVSELG